MVMQTIPHAAYTLKFTNYAIRIILKTVFILLIMNYTQFLALLPVFARFARRHVCTVIIVR